MREKPFGKAKSVRLAKDELGALEDNVIWPLSDKT
jgi:hypothetical protein